MKPSPVLYLALRINPASLPFT